MFNLLTAPGPLLLLLPLTELRRAWETFGRPRGGEGPVRPSRDAADPGNAAYRLSNEARALERPLPRHATPEEGPPFLPEGSSSGSSK